ncbi:MAG: formate dehydrogenase accessory sulfurtransferase FdhD [Clostridia bacterium]|nr:formate dehydrogenase accessory sulfurtransferase FdhD [Clostridia bacterium]
MDSLMQESLVPWSLNGVSQPPLLCTKQDEEAMLIGHLLTSGLIDSAACVHSIRPAGDAWLVSAHVSGKAGTPALLRLDTMPPNRSGRTVSAERLNRLCGQVMALDHAAGLHSVLLWDGEKSVVGRDVGRHNALDKAVGMAVKEGLRLDQAVLCSSGRLSLEMFAKAALAGIPILATRKQVGNLSVSYGEKLDIAVCRTGTETVCYASPWRVTASC